ncbi:MAG: hypothetical protein ACLFT0_14875 [Spirulinaceae cyanobacterium]
MYLSYSYGNNSFSFLINELTIRVQELIILSQNSEPEPDIVLARLREDDYLESHSQPDDIFL